MGETARTLIEEAQRWESDDGGLADIANALASRLSAVEGLVEQLANDSVITSSTGPEFVKGWVAGKQHAASRLRAILEGAE